MHVKSSTLYGRSYGRTSNIFRLDGLLLFCIIIGLRELRSNFFLLDDKNVLPFELVFTHALPDVTPFHASTLVGLDFKGVDFKSSWTETQ